MWTIKAAVLLWLLAAEVESKDVVCKGKKRTTVKIGIGEEYVFKTAGWKYKPRQNCRADYKLDGCRKVSLSCSKFQTVSGGSCNKGDRLHVKARNEGVKRFCGSNGPNLLMKSNFYLQFISDKKRNSRGIDCTIRCMTTPSTITTSTTSTTTTNSPGNLFPAIPTSALTSGCVGYITLTDDTRNVDHYGSPFYCDNLGSSHTSPGWKGDNWYRFTSGAGVVMPESFPGTHHCGTYASGWLNTTHPTNINQTKQAQVCFHWTSSICQWSQDIFITNCGDFYVYYLQFVPLCGRYCGADQP